MAPALGTLFYMAPEQADLKAAPDARWDVYALGAVMYRMLTGSPPHREDAGASLVLGTGTLDEQLSAYRLLIETSPPPSAHRKVPGVDAGLAAIVSKCLAANPRARYPNPQAVLTALDAWAIRRVRRPLMWLTGVGFALLLAVMALIGTILFRDTVTTTQHEVINRTLEENHFAARAEAEQMGLEAEHRWRILEFVAADPKLRARLAEGPALAAHPGEQQALEKWLADRRAKYNLDFDPEDRASVWLALDAGGFLRGTDPPNSKYRNAYTGYRDYFTGLGRNTDERTGPPKAIVHGPHRSVVYRRRSTGTWAVTYSVPVPSGMPGADPVGVLAMSVEIKTEATSADSLNRFSVLIDTRADGDGKQGLVVRHPYLATLPPDTDDANLPRYHAGELVERAAGRQEGWTRMPEYRDPVDREPFGGLWLAAAVPVTVRLGQEQPVDTGFVVVVQERRDEVLAPVRALQWRLGYGAAAAVAFVLVLVGAMWAGMVSMVDGSSQSRVTRFLRRWAGLPTATSGTRTAGTGTAGTGTAGSASAGPMPVSAEPTPQK
jgi:hypothetical protein